MSNEVSEKLSPEEARSYIYGLLARAFSHPDQEFMEGVITGKFIDTLSETAELLPYPSPFSTEVAPLIDSGKSLSDIDIFYASTFEAGQTGVSLRESSYSKKSEASIFESAFRFYEHFGLSFKENKLSELPDHLSVELEFMHYLSYLQSNSDDNETVASLISAQKDFLQRHLNRWIPQLELILVTRAEGLLYDQLARLLNQFLPTDEQFLIQC